MATTMAGVIARAVFTSRRSAPSLFLSRRLLSSSSSIVQAPPLPGFMLPRRPTVRRPTVLLSHAVRVVAPGACRLNPVRCRVHRSGDGDYSLLKSGSNFSDRPPTEMAPLFPGCDYEHWLIVMDKPGGEGATKQQMIDCYIQTLANVVGSDSYVDPENKDYGGKPSGGIRIIGSSFGRITVA